MDSRTLQDLDPPDLMTLGISIARDIEDLNIMRYLHPKYVGILVMLYAILCHSWNHDPQCYGPQSYNPQCYGPRIIDLRILTSLLT